MIAKDFAPSPHLREYISQYRLRHFVFANAIIAPPKPFPPRPEQCVVFYLRGSETTHYFKDGTKVKKPRSVISGQFTYRCDRVINDSEILMLMVDFQPGALHRLTGIPFVELTNKDFDAEDVLPKIKGLNDRLSGTDAYPEIVQLVEQFFTELVQSSTPELLPVDRLLISLKDDPDHSIDWLARHACLSPRQLERKLNERIGIAPKTYLRISRFAQSYWLHLKKPSLSWYHIAMTCGYTDYQHLVKDYKAFAHANPIDFFKEERNAPGRILGLTK
ncbi:helix-turn-helix domain-containing protein [Paracnuella aquatica]|uniref:helix-turn-helix domain-containing protein n=1 Tax=Paracnuella aquatica TaxID=2268757 RepID=UPI000DF00977|nr:helix-turn-helix domain-containing protein [Paracnuella aquatica]RPD46506.1 AraC family transcriptional regulator [Paracnuella aquatica]